MRELAEIPNESWEDCKKRMTEHWQKIQSSMENVSNAIATEAKRASFPLRILNERGKFGELEYELEFRLRHTYINPKTGEQEYRPDDDVGEGLICVGSRDHNPKREDFDD